MTKNKFLKFINIFIFFAAFSSFIFAENETTLPIEKNIPYIKLSKGFLPLIPSLKSRDPVFMQYTDEVSESYKNASAGKNVIPSFYAYVVQKDDKLLAIAARCNISYETIATLNGIPSADYFMEGKTIVLPTAIGIFVPDVGVIKAEEPLSALESIMQKNRNQHLEENNLICYNFGGRNFLYLRNERFTQTERAFFLDTNMKLPIEHYALSSAFGKRHNPFTGTWQFHKGIDMAAPVGTKVFACKGGTVTDAVLGNAVFGNYVAIKHSNGMTSFYAHLSKFIVTKGQVVQGGEIIGYVGQTGQVTGPHLHFEIRINGRASDPQNYLLR